ncbi:hypothetical protein PPL_08268 [Heterostelium album PN500]|uniref:IPT/TIG domain-containing protein n=1 Tax=Heterostelium pallidum (strain ATCC 26659 / Pp 5 / PN500) TaxID=670386 RepID=D3BHQ5_HETP5|nr:hypothetical protein PPL_08268 [Heterostelium album PN500]EFA78805.1 hypothetical protein PPL_08268 [Heterostelium album PN500]|eukprot:XP_020430929.1 hypothetical protein PPL_08268 [Heterostelium album PN500]
MPPPNISLIQYVNNNLTITGYAFLNPVAILGISCINLVISATNVMTCQLQDVPNRQYNIQVECYGQISNVYSFTTPIYSWMTSVNLRVPLEESKVTVTGVNLAATTIFTIGGTNLNLASRSINANNTAFEVDIPANPVAGKVINYVLSSTGMTVINNVVINSTYTGITIMDDDVVQNGNKITITGTNFDLYNGNFSLNVGNASYDILCPNFVSCITTVPNTATNGLFVIYSRPSKYVLWQSNEDWLPYISSVTPNVANVTGQVVLSTIFVDRTTMVSTDLNGKYNVPCSSVDGKTFALSLFPKFVGTVNLTISNLQSNMTSLPVPISYPGPIINSFVVNPNNQSELLVNGSYLGFSDVTTYPGMPLTIPFISGLSKSRFGPTNYNTNQHIFDSFTVPLPNDARSGTYSLSVGTKFTVGTIYLTPIIEKITSPPVQGGSFTVTGKFISPLSYDSQTVLTIYFNGNDPMNLTMLTQTYPYIMEISVGPGVGRRDLAFYNPLNSNPTLFNVYYQAPTILSATSTYFGTPGNVTIFGSNFYLFQNSFEVEIGNKSCDAFLVEPNMIVCHFSSDVASPDGSLNITVTMLTQSFFGQRFIYLPSEPGCVGCNSTNGQCQNGYCMCNNQYVGVNCTIRIPEAAEDLHADIPQPLNDTVAMTLGSAARNVQFNISLVSISEKDDHGATIKSYQFSDIDWTLLSSPGTPNTYPQYNYRGIFSVDSKLVIDVEMLVFTNQTKYNFQGDIFTAQNNSMKYVITISNWTFGGAQNTLELSFLNEADIKAKVGGCRFNGLLSLRTMEIVQDGLLLTAFFSDRILVDGTVQYSNVSAPDSKSSTKESLQVLTTITIPYFKKQVVIDPNFGALVAFDSSSSDSPSSNTINWKIPVIVVCVVVGVTIIVITVVLLKKKYSVEFKLATVKLRNLSRSDKKRVN